MSSLHVTTPANDTSTRMLSSPSGSSRKIQPGHQERLAIVYVRQSTQQQVIDNRESTARQYALVDQAIHLGWPADRVEVIDDDQATSGSTAEGRQGFHRLLADWWFYHAHVIHNVATPADPSTYPNVPLR